ncbi:hypothetical protein BGX28_001720 [Mortierella sp. GBA30]|nr:hypothetical protein BGX28_001720 [Mortierella sp. GBA30]
MLNNDTQSHPHGYEDVETEIPYGWIVVAAAFFVQAIVIGTINGYGVYQVSFKINFQRRGFATGIAVAGGGFGGLVISPATSAMFSRIGYRWTVRVIAFTHLAILVPAAILFKTRVQSGKDKTERLKRLQSDQEIAMFKQEKRDVMAIDDDETIGSRACRAPKEPVIDFSTLKNKRFFILVCVTFFVAMGYFNPYYYFPTYAQKNGVSAPTASLLIGILNGSSSIGRVLMGLASDYIGDINTLLISCLAASLSIMVVWMFSGHSILIMVVFCVLYGFFSGSFVAIIPTVASHLCGITRLASATGMVYGGMALGTLIGSPIGGALLDLSKGVDYRPLQLWAGSAMLVGIALVMMLKFRMNPSLLGRV